MVPFHRIGEALHLNSDILAIVPIRELTPHELDRRHSRLKTEDELTQPIDRLDGWTGESVVHIGVDYDVQLLIDEHRARVPLVLGLPVLAESGAFVAEFSLVP